MGEGYDLESGVLKQAIKHAPGKRTVGATALQRQVDDFLSSDIFLGSSAGSTGVRCTKILIDQFHCCCGGISCHSRCVDNSPLLHCKGRNIIFLADLVFQKRKRRKIWAVASAAEKRGSPGGARTVVV